jgi:hypothetical protein
MAISPTSPLPGATQPDLTSPTYTLVSDYGPNSHSKQWIVSSLGGTQTGVDTHSVSKPFTLTVERPSNFRQFGGVNPVTGVVSNVPNNVYVVRTRKGVVPLSGQNPRNCIMETRIVVPAGSDTADLVNLEAGLSAHIGLLSDISTDLGGTVENGSI